MITRDYPRLPEITAPTEGPTRGGVPPLDSKWAHARSLQLRRKRQLGSLAATLLAVDEVGPV